MLRWLHISDLHIKEKADWINFKMELFNKCKEIGKIDFVIVTGDFHDFSDGKSFDKAIDFLQSLIAELHLNIEEDLFVIPGNHDGTTKIKNKETFILAA